MQNHAVKMALLCNDMQGAAWKFVHFNFSYSLVRLIENRYLLKFYI
jgi:hypothetical protein